MLSGTYRGPKGTPWTSCTIAACVRGDDTTKVEEFNFFSEDQRKEQHRQLNGQIQQD